MRATRRNLLWHKQELVCWYDEDVIKFLAFLFLLLQPLVAAEKQEQQLQRFSPSLVFREWRQLIPWLWLWVEVGISTL